MFPLCVAVMGRGVNPPLAFQCRPAPAATGWRTCSSTRCTSSVPGRAPRRSPARSRSGPASPAGRTASRSSSRRRRAGRPRTKLANFFLERPTQVAGSDAPPPRPPDGGSEKPQRKTWCRRRRKFFRLFLHIYSQFPLDSGGGEEGHRDSKNFLLWLPTGSLCPSLSLGPRFSSCLVGAVASFGEVHLDGPPAPFLGGNAEEDRGPPGGDGPGAWGVVVPVRAVPGGDGGGRGPHPVQ